MSDKEKGLSDIIKRIVSVGVGSAFMTEEAVRNILADLPLPKDIVTGLVHNAKQAKSDFLDTISAEVKDQLSKVDPAKLVDDLVERYDIEVSATFKFKKKAQSAQGSQGVSKSASAATTSSKPTSED